MRSLVSVPVHSGLTAPTVYAVGQVHLEGEGALATVVAIDEDPVGGVLRGVEPHLAPGG
jgi:hypothetical protein